MDCVREVTRYKLKTASPVTYKYLSTGRHAGINTDTKTVNMDYRMDSSHVTHNKKMSSSEEYHFSDSLGSLCEMRLNLRETRFNPRDHQKTQKAVKSHLA